MGFFHNETTKDVKRKKNYEAKFKNLSKFLKPNNVKRLKNHQLLTK